VAIGVEVGILVGVLVAVGGAADLHVVAPQPLEHFFTHTQQDPSQKYC
jgi:hypothetical protein